MTQPDAELTYLDSEWAARRWDRFNEGRIIEPLSFCQFWRTVLLWATIKQLATPMRPVVRVGAQLSGSAWVRRLAVSAAITILVAGVAGAIASGSGADVAFAVGIGAAIGLLGNGLAIWLEPRISDEHLLALGQLHLRFWRSVGHGLWVLAWPFRKGAPPVGRGALNGAVTVGEPVVAWGSRHKEGLEVVGSGALVLAAAGVAIGVLTLFLLEDWLVTLIGIGSLVVGALAIYGFVKSAIPGLIAGVLALLWEAAVAAKHGICPPVRIVREP